MTDATAELEAERQRLLAELLADEGFDAPGGAGIVARHRAEAPLGYAQELLWLVEQMHPGVAVSNIPELFDLRGPLDVSALQAALAGVVANQSAYRTAFREHGGNAVQVVQPGADVPWRIVDLQRSSPTDAVAEAARLVREETMRPFDLGAAPLMRALLVRRSADEWTLLLVQHHLVCDGWSRELLVAELGAGYDARVAGGHGGTGAPPIEFGDFAAWQRTRAEQGDLDSGMNFWRGQVRGAAEILELPTDQPRGAAREFGGATESITLPRALMDAAWQLGHDRNVTPFMTMFAAFQVMLARYTGQDDFLIGTPVAGRTRTETERVIGYFANMVALRTDIAGDPGFATLLQRVSSRCLAAFEHQDVPFEVLVEALGRATSSSHTPLFQTMFSLQQGDLPPLQLRGLSVTRRDFHAGWSTYDLWFTAVPLAGGLRIGIEYRTDLFAAETIRRMLGHFSTLLQSAVADPETPVSRLPMLGARERTALADSWNATDTRFARADSIHELFEAQAAKTPDAVAVQDDARTLTYRELDTRANQLANHLASLGVGRGALVGVSVERSVEMMVALFGVMKAGAAYVPLDPDYPADRLAFMLNDSGAQVLVTHEAVRERFGGFGGMVVSLDRDAAALVRAPAPHVRHATTPDDLAYVIYTSGSTGVPKGAMLPHRAVVNYLQWMQAQFSLGAGDCVLQKAPVSFDASVWELYLPLIAGARLFLARPDGHRDPEYLVATIAAQRVTVLQFVPSLLAVVLDDLAMACKDVRLLILGGEALPADLATRLRARLPTLIVYNLYGPTECAVYATAWELPADFRGSIIPIGKPIANDRVYVLHRGTSQLAPMGVAGELCIAGTGVGTGYLNRPELTAERFVADPFRDGRMYRTGDLARWRANGDLEFLGRIDHQVKVRGFRVELGEIESALGALPGVRECAVIQRSDALVGYVVLHGDASVNREALRTALRGRLPDYMVPGTLMVLDAMPLNANGKLDRKALPDVAASASARERVAPRSPLEAQIAAVWAEVLGLEHVGVEDDFFELGGHSLLGMRILTRLQSLLQRRLPLRLLLDARTIARLAQAIAAQDPSTQPAEPIATVRGADAPQSFAQELLWFVERMIPGLGAYNGPEVLRVRGALDVQALTTALGDLIMHQDAFRTEFYDDGDMPRQRVVESVSVPVLTTDLRAAGSAEARNEARRLLLEDTRRPVDLTRAPLLRAHVVQVAGDEWFVGLFTHHIVSDDWSRGIILRELGQAYAARLSGGVHQFAPLAVRYCDYAAWQRQRMQGERLEALLGYWRAQLANAPEVLELPTDYPRPPVRGFAGARRQAMWPRELVDAAKRLGNDHGATLFMTVLAAFEVVLARHSGQDDFVVGTPVAGRNREDLEGVVGYFANVLALRADLRGSPTFADVLARTRATCLGAYDHQEIPFEALVAELSRGIRPSHAPIFQTMFVLLNAEPPAARLDGADVSLEDFDAGWSRFDLWLSCREDANGMRADLEFRTDLFEPSTADRILQHVRQVLVAATRDPLLPVSQLQMLSADERDTVVRAWNDSAVDFPVVPSVHALFAAQVAETPDAIAVQDDARQLTYGELDARSNQLAAYLVTAGVKPRMLVGVALERSVDLMVGLLAVLKTGAAYVPLDSSYPRERLAMMIASSGIRLLVTQQSVREALPAFDGHVVSIDGAESAAIAATPIAPVESAVSPEDLAYVIYTSGSTGTPKGAMLPHRAVVNYLQWMQAELQPGQGDCILQKAPVSFDASVWELYLPLIAGARVHFARPDGHREPGYLLDTMRERGVTIVQFVPSLLAAMLDIPGAEAAFRGVRQLVLGGEALPGELAVRARAVCPSAIIYNLYGPTEAAVYATAWQVPTDFGGGIVPIGRPIANDQVYLLAAGTTEPVPIGVPGELCIGGRGVGAGYWGQPQLSAEKFVPDPFRGDGCLYRTGDLARFRPDGVIEFLGRIDHQVKVRGFRVEMGEIEAAILTSPGVRECVVMQRAEARLVAYLVAQPGRSIDMVDLRVHIAASLPEYMIPAAFVVLETFPLSANGKIDRAALPEPLLASVTREYVAPRNALETEIAEAWQAVLGRECVGVDDDFFEIGGHSLLGMRILARLQGSLHRQLPLRMLFEARTVAGLAAQIAQLDEASEMERLLATLESVSDEEAARLLGPDTEPAVPR